MARSCAVRGLPSTLCTTLTVVATGASASRARAYLDSIRSRMTAAASFCGSLETSANSLMATAQ
jgi:hypothetical protein